MTPHQDAKTPRPHSLSEVLTDLEMWALKDGAITVETLVRRLGERGLGLIVVVLALPFLQPVPMAGLSTVLGGVVVVVGMAMFSNRQPWIPRRIAHRLIPVPTLLALCGAGKKVFSFTEKFIKPRGNWINENESFKKVSAVFIIMSALLLALPLPIPLTNPPPAAAMLFLALGFIERDWVAVAFGYFCFFVTIVYFSFIGWSLMKGAAFVLPKFGSG